ncbi:FIG000325: clustered with transcription termination protein NusA [Candidatus Phaeomarinobacter ectocarpi]|uniref:Ribosome maturation factor RimP n=1 Tax=Candidatus Phaeomarinibacter ectocarpi TaxID=1458461 RepID=X5M8Y3_9HYPH|nr:FIG000325: clustered with transcription termination protein NusA [Candidatus Phaeomarinobacter ectocarpi]
MFLETGFLSLKAKTPAEERIEGIIAPLVESLGYEIVRIRVIGSGTPTLQIMAEKADGTMPIEGCEEVSRAVSAALDVDDPISGKYTLEVSSAGIDRPLTREKDFETWAGHLAKVELQVPIDGRKRFRGLLDGFATDENEIRIAVEIEGFSEPQVVGLPFGDVHDAKLVLTDALIKQSQKSGGASPKPSAPTELETLEEDITE